MPDRNPLDHGLHVLSLSLHGLVRGFDIELGRDADTGGQITYVVEQVRALAAHPDVRNVQLFTRQVFGPKVDASYAEEHEELAPGAEIVRIPCGPRRYLRKEKLWPYLDEFVDRTMRHLRAQRDLPDVVHGHYADAGYVGSEIARLLGVPFVFTGHSLGRVKKQRLLAKKPDRDALDRQFNFPQRIEAEEVALETASVVITSTQQEVDQQYELYDHYEPERMEVIPPGVDLSRFRPPGENDPKPAIAHDLDRFFVDPDKPLVVALARPDERKNLTALIRAFGQSETLRERANLAILAGNRDDIRELGKASRRVLTELLLEADHYDLWGKVALPKHHRPEDVPELYRWTARTRGVFVNPALTEPFGLTLIEAAASGVPIVATNDGGPRDIIASCRNGRLVDPLDDDAITAGIEEIVGDPALWEELSTSGIDGARRTYGWHGHVDRLVGEVRRVILGTRRRAPVTVESAEHLRRADRAVVVELDGILDQETEKLPELRARLEELGDQVALGIVTGRRADAARKVIAALGLPDPHFLISASGTEIEYGSGRIPDRSWARHIDHRWRPGAVQQALLQLEGLSLQPEAEQRRFKISFYLDEDGAPSLRKIRRSLRQHGVTAKCVLSDESYLDVVPVRASPGRALRFLAWKWELWPDRVLVVGRTGIDEDMLRGDTLGVVVADHSPELSGLRDRPRVHFVSTHGITAVLEGMDHYDFLGAIRAEDPPADVMAAKAGDEGESH